MTDTKDAKVKEIIQAIRSLNAFVQMSEANGLTLAESPLVGEIDMALRYGLEIATDTDFSENLEEFEKLVIYDDIEDTLDHLLEIKRAV